MTLWQFRCLQRLCLCASIVVIAGFCTGTPSALAGAWTRAEGSGQLITTTARKVAPTSQFFADAPQRDTQSMQIFLEYGLTEEITVGGSLRAEYELITQQLELRLALHTRFRFWQGADGDVASVQIGGSYPFEGNLGIVLINERPWIVPNADIMLFYGRGWQTGWGDPFLSAGAGYRWRGGNEADEIRAEISSGHRVTRHWMGLLNMTGAYPIEEGGTRSLKVSPSVAYTFWPRLGTNDKKPSEPVNPSTIQVGVTYDVMNADDGLEVGVSVWRRF